MTDRRRARLERKISEIPVPPPPAGLAERIKRDIPERLPASSAESLTELSPYRIWLRVAAILLVVVASSFVAMQLLVQDMVKPSVQTADVAEADMKKDVAIPPPPSLAAPSVVAPYDSARSNVIAAAEPSLVQKALPQSPTRAKLKNVERPAEESIAMTAVSEANESKRLEKSQEDSALKFDAIEEIQMATGSASKEVPAQSKDEVARDEGAASGGTAGGVVGGKIEIEATAAAPAVTAAAPLPPAPPHPSALSRKQSSMASNRSDDFRAAEASFYENRRRGFQDADEKAVSSFPLHAGTDSYLTARAHLLEGRLPPPESVRVEDFVNSFQYDDAVPSQGNFSLVAEGSASPFPTRARYHVVRFGVRPRAGLDTTATVEVNFNDHVVQRYRLLGYESRGPAGSAANRVAAAEPFPPAQGVVALYEVKLLQKFQRDDVLAALKVRYRSSKDELVEISKEIRAREVEQAWLDSPRSIQLASIVASFAEVLRGEDLNGEVSLDLIATRVRFVADRYPGNVGVRELLTLIETAAGLKKTEAAR